MSSPVKHQISRRDFLKHAGLSAGAALGTTLWPGCARFAGNGKGGAFSFAVINDAHFQSPKCPDWFARVFASVRAQNPRPEFCLVVGDLAEHGTAEELGAMREILRSWKIEHHVVIGNHDYVGDNDRSTWDALLPNRLNYHFAHRGWQFIGLDSSEGRKAGSTKIQPATLSWLDDNFQKLDPANPTVVFTHFPMGRNTIYRPLNADDLLARFEKFNLISVFNGHFHGFTERHIGNTTLTTNRCCSISRRNHDGTPEKGYFYCTAREGMIERVFVEVKTYGLSI
jgi:hypothetical protein